ncbi:hypothetical protein C8R43DRAFT_13199 [Mycena crocata]|nr:hypothetical protein C8R43DRAFT_13199 [Mycena crocata]
MASLALFPEELLERILADVVTAKPTPNPRAPWHPSPARSRSSTTASSSSTAQTTTQIRTRTAALLVSRAFHRIALPLFYHTLVLHSPSQSTALLQALHTHPHLARAVRTVVLPAPSRADARVLRTLPDVRVLDVTLPPTLDDAPDEGAGEHIGDALRALSTLRTLTIRKAAGTYLSQPAPRAVLDALASAVSLSPMLHTLTTSFPLSADPALASLVSALASPDACPALETLRTPVPSVWGPPASPLTPSAISSLPPLTTTFPAATTTATAAFPATTNASASPSSATRTNPLLTIALGNPGLQRICLESAHAHASGSDGRHRPPIRTWSAPPAAFGLTVPTASTSAQSTSNTNSSAKGKEVKRPASPTASTSKRDQWSAQAKEHQQQRVQVHPTSNINMTPSQNTHYAPRPVLGTSLFLAEARKHARLAECIRRGTEVLVPAPHGSSSSYPSSYNRCDARGEAYPCSRGEAYPLHATSYQASSSYPVARCEGSYANGSGSGYVGAHSPVCENAGGGALSVGGQGSWRGRAWTVGEGMGMQRC